jgi:phospholipid transport system substrate-binding protein
VNQYNSEMTFQNDVVDGNQAVVQTTLLLGKGGQMSLDYRMHHPRDRWQVYDLSIDGISLVASYRSQFNKIVRTDSYEGLVARLKSRQVGFAAPTAGQSGGQPAR